MSEPAKTKAALAVVEIAFREVGPIYDSLGAFKRVIGSPGEPRVVYQTGIFSLLGATRDPSFEDEFGEPVRAVKDGDDLPSVYQVQRITGLAPMRRTFSRKLASKIDKKFVYVFETTDKAGGNPKLLAELAFEGGEFQYVDLKAHAGKDDRPAAGDKRSKLYVEAKSLSRDKGPFLWFLLAPYQIPWSGLDELLKSGTRLTSNCQRLFDEFWMDAYVAGGQPKSVFELQDEIKQGKPLGFLMYLLDPFKEAAHRAALYAEAVEAWEKVQTDLKSDSEYVLAKRLENLPREYVNIVWPKLGDYLGKKEAESRKLLRGAASRLEDLLRWVGESHKRDRATIAGVTSDTFYLGKGVGMASNEVKEDAAWTNPFSDLVAAYNQPTTPEDIYKKVGDVVTAVHARLGELPRGQDFLGKMVRDSERLPIANAGAGLLFQAKRKGIASAAETVGGLLQFYAPKWVEVYRKEALPQLIEFMRKQHKIELKKIKPKSVRKAEAALARRAHRAAARQGIEKLAEHYHLEVDPASARAIGMGSAALNRLMIGVELFNLKISVDEWKAADLWTSVGLAGSVFDAYLAFAKVYPKIESVSYTIGGVSKTIKIAPVIAILSSTIDTVMAARDAYNSTNFGQQAGHSIRTLGAAMTVGGAAAAETGVGVVVAILGIGLQAVGQGIAAEFDDMNQFLRHTKWGERSALDKVSDAVSDTNNFGYKGELEDLHKDITAQHRALDWMFFAFNPSFEVFNGARIMVPSSLRLKMNPPEKVLGPTAQWRVKLKVVNPNNGVVMKTYEYTATDEFDHAALSSNDDIAVISVDPPMPSAQPVIRAHWGKVHVEGEIQLDVFGDGSSLVTREVTETFELNW